jgi:hypothetical protein
MTYRLTQGETILCLSDNTFIPPDPQNFRFQEYLRWLEEGNTPEPALEPPQLTPLEKLQQIGLTIEELKSLLDLTP